MEKALAGLPGVVKAETDYKNKDHISIAYNPELVKPERMLEIVKNQGFRGEIKGKQ